MWEAYLLISDWEKMARYNLLVRGCLFLLLLLLLLFFVAEDDEAASEQSG